MDSIAALAGWLAAGFPHLAAAEISGTETDEERSCCWRCVYGSDCAARHV
jgi:hypothetical protein